MKAIFSILLLCCLTGAGGAAEAFVQNNSRLNVTLIDYGSIGDHGWTYEAHLGAARMAEKHSYVNLSERENAAGSGASHLLARCAEDGADLIFCHSSAFHDAVADVAPLYPDVIFMLGGGEEKPADNAGVYYSRIYEAEYLAGIVAGNMTRTDKVAFSAALPTPQVIIGINAFARGVAASNPDARIYVQWIGEWYNPEKERAVAMMLIDSGCDVITHWSDSDATGQAADEMNIYFISFGSDMGRFSPRVFLTGAVWDWEPVMSDIVESVHNGTWRDKPGQEWWYGLADGAVNLAPYGEMVPDSVRSFVEGKRDELLAGRAVFAGLSDQQLKTMYYLEPNVEGVLPPV